MDVERAKGTRDFLPEDKILRNQVTQLLVQIFEKYGYSPLETPVLERYDVLASKYAGGAEILKETFKLKDQGQRDLALRYDLTVPFARVIAMNPTLKMPFKRYQIGDVFRDGPLKAGRYRQFIQCDVDVVGVKTMKGDAELLCLATDFFTQLGMPFEIKVNNRKILDAMMDLAAIPVEKRDRTILALDKLEKVGERVVQEELRTLGISQKSITTLFSVVQLSGTNAQKMSKLKKILPSNAGITEIASIMDYFSDFTFDPSLARGLSYYTGTIFEVYLTASEIKSSVAAGGRYDNMITQFIGRGEYPAVGISFGLDVLCDALKLVQNKAAKKTVTDIYLIPLGTSQACFALAQKLRKNNIKVDLDLNDRGVSKNLDYASKMSIPFVVFLGEDEIKKKKVKLRDMQTGKEVFLTEAELIKQFSRD